MRKLVFVCLLMLCLAIPAFAGHILVGGRSEWCECGSVPECICDEGELPQAHNAQQPPTNAQKPPTDLGSETLLVLAVLLLMLRYKS
jgi:hypothetical protein